MARTLIRNISGAPVTLPPPYNRIMPPGSAIEIDDLAETFYSRIGGAAATMRVLAVKELDSAPRASIIEQRVLVRPGGDDKRGDGTTAAPFATVQRALKLITADMTGKALVIDNTGCAEVVPGGLVIPPFSSSDDVPDTNDPSYRTWKKRAALTIEATPVIDDQIADTDITLVERDTVTGMLIVTTSRDWAQSSLVSKLFIDATGAYGMIMENSAGPNTVLLVTGFWSADPVAPVDLCTQGAEIGNSDDTSLVGAINMRATQASVVFSGLKFTSLNESALQLSGCTRPIGLHGCYVEGARLSGLAAADPTGVAVERCMFTIRALQLYGVNLEGHGAMFWAQMFVLHSHIAMQHCDVLTTLGAYTTGVDFSNRITLDVSYCRIGLGVYGLVADHNTCAVLGYCKLGEHLYDAIYCKGGKVSLTGVVCDPDRALSNGYGIRVEDGGHVLVDATTDVTATTGDMLVGANAARTWADFRTAPAPRLEVDATDHLARLYEAAP